MLSQSVVLNLRRKLPIYKMKKRYLLLLKELGKPNQRRKTVFCSQTRLTFLQILHQLVQKKEKRKKRKIHCLKKLMEMTSLRMLKAVREEQRPRKSQRRRVPGPRYLILMCQVYLTTHSVLPRNNLFLHYSYIYLYKQK
ncbi:uncharacterized protein LOC102809543 [Saccoglossus kowalevskii]|uniref:Uncharacterized protein LOC102809543 n=1 Tax=Saccoglossus kowalevskii TaxID=10224 RepID=A0ABM0LVQ4_SACKO|nr:PREDICTED: uncharacterized protein LOC102809543 [Saccoglossus kowalevskii]